MSKPTCSIDGCERPVSGQGWCNAHYKRYLRHGDPLGGGPERGAVQSKRGPYGGCWEWGGATNQHGYGWTNSKDYSTQLVHRIVFAEIYGHMPDLLRHRCDNPPCYRPDHLLPGTKADNTRDMIERGRSTRGRHPRSKLTEDAAEAILIHPQYQGSGKELAERFGVSPQVITDVRKGRRWRWVADRLGVTFD